MNEILYYDIYEIIIGHSDFETQEALKQVCKIFHYIVIRNKNRIYKEENLFNISFDKLYKQRNKSLIKNYCYNTIYKAEMSRRHYLLVCKDWTPEIVGSLLVAFSSNGYKKYMTLEQVNKYIEFFGYGNLEKMYKQQVKSVRNQKLK